MTQIDYRSYALKFAWDLQQLEKSGAEMDLSTIELLRRFKIELGISIPESVEEGSGSSISRSRWGD